MMQDSEEYIDNIRGSQIEAVNLGDSSQIQLRESVKPADSRVNNEQVKNVVENPVTIAELQSVESLLTLVPAASTLEYEKYSHVVQSTIKVHMGKNPSTSVKVHNGKTLETQKKPDPKQSDEQTPENPGSRQVPDRPMSLNERLTKTIASDKIRNEKRYSKPGGAFCSPYCNRVVTMIQALLEREMGLLRYTFATYAKESTLFYKSRTGVQTYKIVFKSFYRGLYIASNGIDAFVDVLNLEEERRDKTSSPYRLFLHSTMLSSVMYGANYTDTQRLKVFDSNMDDILQKYKVNKVDQIDLIFVPILQVDHFYYMCFHMGTGKVEVIDNSGVEAKFEDKYGELPKILRRVLVLFLKKLKRKQATKQMETSIIERNKMEWRTVNNCVDCGVFTMRHMETYKGKTPWSCGFEIEGARNNRQNGQLKLLRNRYLSKIIFS